MKLITQDKKINTNFPLHLESSLLRLFPASTAYELKKNQSYINKKVFNLLTTHQFSQLHLQSGPGHCCNWAVEAGSGNQRKLSVALQRKWTRQQLHHQGEITLYRPLNKTMGAQGAGEICVIIPGLSATGLQTLSHCTPPNIAR